VFDIVFKPNIALDIKEGEYTNSIIAYMFENNYTCLTSGIDRDKCISKYRGRCTNQNVSISETCLMTDSHTTIHTHSYGDVILDVSDCTWEVRVDHLFAALRH